MLKKTLSAAVAITLTFSGAAAIVGETGTSSILNSVSASAEDYNTNLVSDFTALDANNGENVQYKVEQVENLSGEFKYYLISFELTDNSKGKTGSISNFTLPELTGVDTTKAFHINFGDGITEINAGAFKANEDTSDFRTHITEITLPSTLEILGDEAFSGCYELHDIKNVPTTIKEFGKNVFKGTDYLNTTEDSIHGVVYVGRYAVQFDGKTAEGTSISFRTDTIGIADEAFVGKEVTARDENGTAVEFGDATEFGKKIQSVTLPDNLEYIGESAFRESDSLASVQLPARLHKFGDYAFCNDSKLELTSEQLANFPSNISEFGKDVFNGTVWYKQQQESSIIQLGGYIYGYKGDKTNKDEFATVYGKERTVDLNKIDESVPVIGIVDEALANLDVRGVVLPETLKYIGKFAFAEIPGSKAGLLKVNIPNSVETIGAGAFYGSNLQAGDNLTFGNNTSAAESSLKSIGWAAFDETPWMVDAQQQAEKNKASVIYLGNYLFAYAPTKDKIDNGKISFNNGMIGIVDNAFAGHTELEEVTFPKSIKFIGDDAFNDTSIKEIDLSATAITTIGSQAFANNDNLSNVNVPGNLTDIADDAFRSTGLYDKYENNEYILLGEGSQKVLYKWKRKGDKVTEDNAIIPKGITAIANGAFANYSKLTSVNIPDSVTNIGNSVFDSALNLKEIDLKNVVSIGDSVFKNSAVQSIKMDKVTSIGADAFANSQIKKIDIPEGVETINEWAFANATALEEVNFPSTIKSIGDYAFYNDVALNGKEIVIPAKDVVYNKDKVFAGITDISVKTEKSPTDVKNMLGDIDGNGVIDTNDALDVLKLVVGLAKTDDAGLNFNMADIDKNSKIDTNDALAILKHVVGLEKIVQPADEVKDSSSSK